MLTIHHQWHRLTFVVPAGSIHVHGLLHVFAFHYSARAKFHGSCVPCVQHEHELQSARAPEVTQWGKENGEFSRLRSG
jgi:hypothetical protein